jgi:alkylation response protein AidB-like acyl-CoA dehydrogenase
VTGASFDAEDRDAFTETVDALLAREATPEALRQLWSDPDGRSPKLSAGLAEIGVPGLLVGEDAGGIGASEVEMVRLLEVLGRRGVHDPVLEGLVAAGFLRDAADPSAAQQWLPRLAAGSARIGLKVASSKYVRDAHLADAILYQAGEHAVLLEKGEYAIARVQSQDPAERLFTVTPAVPLPGAGSLAWAGPASERAEARLHVGIGALLSGVSAYLLTTTVDYVLVRQQFGRPIGQFQALKHMLADAYARMWLATEAVRAASVELAGSGGGSGYASRAARLAATDAARLVSDTALQCHGGIGFTWEHDLHGYLKAAKAYEYAYGGGPRLAREVGAASLSAASAA